MTSLSKEEQAHRLEKLLEDFSITHIRKSLGMALSGGERRRVEIARALAGTLTDPEEAKPKKNECPECGHSW